MTTEHETAEQREARAEALCENEADHHPPEPLDLARRTIDLEISVVAASKTALFNAEQIAQGITDGLGKDWFSDPKSEDRGLSDADDCRIEDIEPADIGGSITFDGEASTSFYDVLDTYLDRDYTLRADLPDGRSVDVQGGAFVTTDDGQTLVQLDVYDDAEDKLTGEVVEVDPYQVRFHVY
jgi:hypothetical protein